MIPIGDDTTAEKDLAAIKDWLKKQPHLPDEWDDACLLSALRGCKFSLENTKRKLDMYFTMRNACPEFFTNRDITRPELMDLMTRAQNLTMPGMQPDGTRVTICKGLDKNLETEQLKDLFKIMMMMRDVRMREDTDDMKGDVFILDTSIIEASHLGKLRLAILKKFFICVQEAYPTRLKEIHVLNPSSLIDTLYNIVKPFLKEKLIKHIHFHKDGSSLHDYISANMLPVDYGGTGCSLLEATNLWVKKLKENGDWLKKQESLKADESLRPGKPKNYDEMFGIDGSFRMLAID